MLLFSCSLNSGSDVWALFKSFVSSNRQWQVSLVPKMVSLLLAKVTDNVESAVFCGVRCSADLSEYYRRDIVFYQGCQCTPEWRQLLVSLRRTHTHSQPDRSAARYTSTTNRWDAPIAFYKTPEASCFIHHDKSLSNSKQSHGVFGVLTCLIVMLYLFEFHWRIVESFMSNADYCYALRLCSDDLRRRKKDFKSDAHRNSFFFFCLLFAVSPYSVIIPVLHHTLIWLLAFLRNRFWWKEDSNKSVAELKLSTAVCSQRFSHCASFNIVCALHPGIIW